MENSYYHSKESVSEYIQLAKDVNGAELIERLKEYLPAQSNLLELGSGPGTDWEILNQDFRVVGSDNSELFLAHLQNSHPTGTFLLLDASTLLTDKTFDGIYANKVLHHLSDEKLRKSIERQHEVLNDQGIICHSFWKGQGSEEFKGMFVNYHTADELRNVYEPKFEILLIESYAEFEEGDSLLLIAKKAD